MTAPLCGSSNSTASGAFGAVLLSGEALLRAGIGPLQFRPKEGLSLINGTQAMKPDQKQGATGRFVSAVGFRPNPGTGQYRTSSPSTSYSVQISILCTLAKLAYH